MWKFIGTLEERPMRASETGRNVDVPPHEFVTRRNLGIFACLADIPFNGGSGPRSWRSNLRGTCAPGNHDPRFGYRQWHSVRRRLREHGHEPNARAESCQRTIRADEEVGPKPPPCGLHLRARNNSRRPFADRREGQNGDERLRMRFPGRCGAIAALARTESERRIPDGNGKVKTLRNNATMLTTDFHQRNGISIRNTD